MQRYTTSQFFHHQIVRDSNYHYRVWGIVPVDSLGRHGYPLIGEEYAFKRRAEAMECIESIKHKKLVYTSSKE